MGGRPGAVVKAACFESQIFIYRYRGLEPHSGLQVSKKQNVSRNDSTLWKSLRDREVACSATDRQGANCEFCVWRTVSSHLSHFTQDFFLTQFSLCAGGLKPHSFNFILIIKLSIRLSVQIIIKKTR